MTEDQLSAIEARAKAATPGPWSTGGTFCPNDPERESVGVWGHIPSGCQSGERIFPCPPRMGMRPRDAYFVAHARTDVPYLVAEVRRLREALDGTLPLVSRGLVDVYCECGAIAIAPLDCWMDEVESQGWRSPENLGEDGCCATCYRCSLKILRKGAK